MLAIVKAMKVEIKEPCHANWNAMLPQEQGRHCAQCDKVVMDFTSMTDARVFSYISQHENICGRFYNHQLNRPISETSNTIGAAKWLGKAAASAFLMSGFLPAPLQAQSPDSAHVPMSTNLKVNTAVSFTNVINGRVIQPDSIHKHIKRLEFSIDTFHLLIDVNTSNEFSFQLPQQFAGDSMIVKLELVDASTQSLKVGGFNNFVSIGFNRPSLCFVYNNERWLSQIITQPVIETYALGGISPQYDFPRLKLFPQLIVNFGYTTIQDTTNALKGDTLLSIESPEKTNYIRIQSTHVKTKSRVWLWYAFIGILGLMLAIFGLKKLRKPINTELNENEINSESEQ